MRKHNEIIKYTCTEYGAIFEANDCIDIGKLQVGVGQGNYPAPVSFKFSRDNIKFSFSMSKAEARRMLAYLIYKIG